ncbi:MAG TPA: hypothetical protein ENJ08_20070 [Gammaproteobacteria bacterium]|nr:hypothetical protein [Gammaproteobacteria bacterium]
MNIELLILKFTNLLSFAHISALHDTYYEKQKALIAQFRKSGQPFLATMPMRHLCRCELCGLHQSEAVFHFENPGMQVSGKSKEAIFGKPVGVWVQLSRLELHNILAHGEKPREELMKVLSA